MNLQLVLDSIVAVCLICGALMSLAAAVGLLRFPDLMSRMHSATKPQVLGLLLMLTAIAIQLRSWSLVPLLVIAWIFQLLTSPVSAHMVGRSGYRTKHRHEELLKIDDLDQVVEAAAQYRAGEYRRAAEAGEKAEEAAAEQQDIALPDRDGPPENARFDDDESRH